MSKSWAIENARFKITSNCILPSLMKTDLTKDIYEKIFDDLESKHPLRKLLTPEEVASEVSALVHSSQYISGTNRIINAAEDVI
jgi:NAD(P)-dependent dehydrogenase (short-subunit alcohol dehydrogenase family)